MKLPRLKSYFPSGLSFLSAALILLAGASAAQADKLIARALTPQEIHDNELVAVPSGGLITVGVGEPVYLEVLVLKEKTVSGTSWQVLQKPFGSEAFIDVSPIPMEMPIYSPADREVYEVADRMMLVPDVEGFYSVSVSVHTSDGTVPLATEVTASNYVGMGIVLGSDKGPAADWSGPKAGQCATCHILQADNKVLTYLDTDHATFFQNAVDGNIHYGGEGCMDCHVLGGHARELKNGNFFDVADHVGWTFPTVRQPGNWDSMPLELREKANIQCEHCHGAGSMHPQHPGLYMDGDYKGISVSLDSGDCAQCHDEEPYHNKNRQWEISGHAVATRYPTGSERRLSCVKCHSGIGFMQEMDGIPDDNKSFEYEAIVCAACHDPHSNEMDNHQLRSTNPITLENGHVVTAGGNGKMCMNCHKARRNAEPYALNPDPADSNGPGKTSSHFGPHYGVQGDLFNGTNAFDYGKVPTGPSPHLYAVEDSCAGCHMQSISNSHPAKNMVGEHTFRMTWDVNNTPEDHHDDVAMTGVCADCHGPLDTFDIPKYDYNYDGVVEGIQTEVHHLLEALALKLHPIGSPEVKLGDNKNHYYTDAEKKALYNYMCVEEDGSFGMHNPRFITGILRASIDDLGDPLNSVLDGVNIPVGGPWYYSPWFEFYSPTGTEGWIYHFTHGYLFVAGDGDNLKIWDPVLNKWLYTNADLYPVMLDVADGAWIYFQGRFGDKRYFYNFAAGSWDVVD